MARRKTPLAERATGFFDLLAEEHRPVAEGKAKAIPLDQIMPDLDQPRRVLPDDLHDALRADDIQPRQAISTLVQRAEEGDLVARLILGDDDEGGDGRGLRALADSIRHVGLRQPPTVYVIREAGSGQPAYRIAEGERRYWAHHLLVQEGHEEFAEMPCLIEELPDDPLVVRARQVVENAMRRDLSAVARARAFVHFKEVIQREFLGTPVPEKSSSSSQNGEFLGTQVPQKSGNGDIAGRGRPGLAVTSHELDDLVAQRVGAVTGRPVSGRLVRNYLRLLTLPARVQAVADAANLTERQLRSLFKLSDRPDLQAEVVYKIVAEKLSSRDVQALVEDIVQRVAQADQAVRSRMKRMPQDSLRRLVQGGLRIRTQLQQQAGAEDAFYDLLTTEEYGDVREQLRELHEWLATVVERLENVGAMGQSLPSRSRYNGTGENEPAGQ